MNSDDKIHFSHGAMILFIENTILSSFFEFLFSNSTFMFFHKRSNDDKIFKSIIVANERLL